MAKIVPEAEEEFYKKRSEQALQAGFDHINRGGDILDALFESATVARLEEGAGDPETSLLGGMTTFLWGCDRAGISRERLKEIFLKTVDFLPVYQHYLLMGNHRPNWIDFVRTTLGDQKADEFKALLEGLE